MHTRVWGVICHWRFIFTFSLGLLPSEPGSSERQTWGRVPPGYFYHGENICRKVVI